MATKGRGGRKRTREKLNTREGEESDSSILTLESGPEGKQAKGGPAAGTDVGTDEIEEEDEVETTESPGAFSLHYSISTSQLIPVRHVRHTIDAWQRSWKS